MPVGLAVTLRGERSYEFLDRLMSIAIPRIRDFRGLNPRSFDGRGNYSLGIREQIIFPEIDYDSIDQVRGLDVTITTTAQTDEEAFALLEAFGMPFSKEGRPAGPAPRTPRPPPRRSGARRRPRRRPRPSRPRSSSSRRRTPRPTPSPPPSPRRARRAKARADRARQAGADRDQRIRPRARSHMAKTSQRVRQQRPPKYKTRGVHPLPPLRPRARAVYRKFGVCRICLRELAHNGYIPGMTKSSW